MPPRAAPAASKPIFNKNHLQETILFLIVLMLVGGIVSRLTYYSETVSSLFDFWHAFVSWLQKLLASLRVIAAIVIGLCAWWAVYSKMKLHNIEKDEEKMYGHHASLAEELKTAPQGKLNAKWTTVLEHLNSNNSSDWRLAIIEADIMLDELLTTLGRHGDSIGDKLKGIEPSDMLTLDAAWEAHKVRNRIAHAGSDFELNEREAKRIIALFESVFKEYQII